MSAGETSSRDEESVAQFAEEREKELERQELEHNQAIDNPNPRSSKVTPGITRNPFPTATVSSLTVTNREFTEWSYSVDGGGWSLTGTYKVTIENESILPVFNVSIDQAVVTTELSSFIGSGTEDVEILNVEGQSVGSVQGGTTEEVAISFESEDELAPGVGNPVAANGGLDQWLVSATENISGVVLSTETSRSEFDIPIDDTEINNDLAPYLEGPIDLDPGDTGTYTVNDAGFAQTYLWEWKDEELDDVSEYDDTREKDITWDSKPGVTGYVPVMCNPTTDLGHLYAYDSSAYLVVQIGDLPIIQ